MRRLTAVLAYGCIIAVVAVLADLSFATALLRPAVAALAGGLVIAIALLVAFTRGRLDPLLVAALAVLAFAGTVAWAVTVDGSFDSVRLTRLDSGGVTLLLAALLLVAVAFETVAARVPLAVKALLLLVELYALGGAAAHLLVGDGIGAAFARNTPYPFDGTWLRAAVVGSAVLLPLAVLAFLAAACIEAFRRRPGAAARLAALAVAVACGVQATGVAAVAVGIPSVVAFEPHLPAAPPAPTAPAIAELRFDDAVAPAVRAEQARIGASRDALFARVAQQTADDGYAGALRGATGTLASGAGNAADKALLLRDLLRAADPSVQLRFATCTLPANEAQRLASTILGARPARAPITFEQADRIAAAAQGTAMQAVMRQWASAWRALVGIVRDEGAALAASFPAAAPVDAANTLTASVTPHVWLQAKSGSAWTDLDPTLGASGNGRARCAAEQTLAVLPPERYAHALVRLTIEERSGSAPVSRDVLAANVRVADLAGRNLAVLFAEPNGIVDVAEPVAPAPSPSRSGGRALRYTPLLFVGERRIAGSTFSVAMPARSAGPGSAAASAAQRASGALDQIGSSAAPSPSPQPAGDAPRTELTAAWLHVALDGPGRPAEDASTPLLDRLGPSARARPTTTAPLRPLPTAGGEVAPFAAVWNVAVWTGVQAAGVGDPSGAADASAAGGDDTAHALASLAQLHSRYAALRVALFESVAGAARAYVVATPSVSFLAAGSGLDPQSPGAEALLADIATDGTQPVLPQGARSPTALAAWSVAGVIAERLLVSGTRALVVGAPQPTALDANDAVATFAAARRSRIAFASVDRAHAQLDGVNAADDARALIASDVEAGHTVVVPRDVPPGAQLAWFSFDPQSGLVRDTMATGRHQELEEETVQTEEEVRQTPFWRRFGKKIACAVSTAGALLALASGDASAAWSMAKIPAKIAQEEEKWRKIGQAACKATGGGEGGAAPP